MNDKLKIAKLKDANEIFVHAADIFPTLKRFSTLRLSWYYSSQRNLLTINRLRVNESFI